MRAGIVNQAIAETSSARGVDATMMRRPTGVIIAPPAPWRSRQKTSCVSDVDMPHSTEPARNTAIAVMKTRFAPKRSATQPLAGAKTASARMYEVSASLR